jgi:pilus assembly protein CpaF
MGSSVAVTGGIGPPAAHVGGHGSGAPALDGAARGAVGEALGPSRAPPKESPEHAARRLAFVTLVDRMTEELESSGIQASPQFDEALVSEVEKIARDQVKAMHDEGEAPPGVDMDVLALEAIREVVGLGALAPLIDDEDVSAVHVLRPDHVIVTRGIDVSLADCAYSSEEALELALERLAIQGGAPLRQDELVVERRLPKGIRLYGTRPPLSASVAVTLTRRVRTEHSLEDAIRAGAMSRQMALFLEQCLLARANIMVVGVSRPLVSRFVAALASLSVVGERVVTWLEDGDVSVGGADILSLAPSEMGDRAGPLLEALGGLDFDRFFVGPLHGALANGVYRTIVQGCDGVVATMLAPSARHAVARLSAQVATTGVPHAIDEARDGLGDAFDVWVEVGRSADGRMRLSRVAELSPQDGKVAALRDIFVLVEGAGAAEGVHAATGVVPRCISEFPSRGVRVDASLFRKPGAVRP